MLFRSKVVELRIATSESWKDRNSGERKEKTEWHSVAIFNEGLANVAERYLRKGSKVYIEGQLQTRKWQDQSGADRYSTEIVLQGFNGQLVMLDGRGEGGGARGGGLGAPDGLFDRCGRRREGRADAAGRAPARRLVAADRARLPRLVRVRAAMPVDDRGDPARDQRLGVAGLHAGLPLRARVGRGQIGRAHV